MEKLFDKIRILIVDDEIDGREFLSELVKEILPKARITKTGNPLEAIEMIKKRSFEIIFTDIRMPYLTGLDMLKQIKAMGHDPYTILVSAYNKFDYAHEGIEVGVNGYILKPLTIEKVQRAINRYVELRKNAIEVKTITVIRGNDTFPVNIQDIVAISKEDRFFISIYLRDSILKSISSSLLEVKKYLPQHCIYINRRTIVNSHCVKKFCHFSKTLVIEHLGKDLYFEASRNGSKNYLEQCQNVIG